MGQVQSLALTLVLFGQRIDRFQSGLVVDASVIEVDHDVIGIVLDVKHVSEGSHGCKEQRAVQLVDLTAKFVVFDIGTNIVHLLRKICDTKKDFSLIINDFNVNWLIKYYDDLLPLFIKNKDRIEDIRMPIQSGSDKILKSMKRPYKIHDVKRVISDLKAKLPNLRLNTHILVGFPGETAFDFEQSRQLLQELDFTTVAVYCYEERPGTLAALMPEKVPTDIRAQRVTALEDFQNSLDVKKRIDMMVAPYLVRRFSKISPILESLGTIAGLWPFSIKSQSR